MLNLGALLLYARRIVFLNGRLCNVLRSRIRLLTSRLVANLTAFRLALDHHVLLLDVDDIRPRAFCVLVRFLLLICRVR